MAAALPIVAADVRTVEEIAAKVNGDIITRGELDERKKMIEDYFRSQGLNGAKLNDAVKKQASDSLRDEIDSLLLVQKGKDLNINIDADVNRRLAEMQVESKITDTDKFHDWIRQQSGMTFEDYRDRMKKEMLSRRVIGQEIGSRIAIPEPDMQKYYEEHKNEFVRKEQVFLSQILISTEGKTPEQAAAAEKKAKDLVVRARKGEKFTDLARENSDDTETAKAGGQLPPYGKGLLQPQIETVVFREKKGYVTDPIKVPQGFVILRVDDRHEAGQATFEEVRNEIQDRLMEPKMEPKVRQYLTRLRQEAFLEIKDGYTDSGAAPGKDTRWHDVAQLKPQTTTKEEVAARRKKKFLGVIPHGYAKPKSTVDTSTLGERKEPAQASQPDQSAQPAQPAQPTQPAQPAQAPESPVKK
jgi:parvulin-like peptidyl-prolyl isomerase